MRFGTTGIGAAARPGRNCSAHCRLGQIGRLMCIAGTLSILALGFRPGGSVSAAEAPTFSKEVAPILFNHCVRCHQPDEIASKVSFLSYEAVRPWAKAIKEKILMREMPPWPADPSGSVAF